MKFRYLGSYLDLFALFLGETKLVCLINYKPNSNIEFSRIRILRLNSTSNSTFFDEFRIFFELGSKFVRAYEFRVMYHGSSLIW